MLPPTPVGPGERRAENLAYLLQEVFTAIERLRSNRQAVPDAASFRFHIRETLKRADGEGRKRGYTTEDIQLAVFAVVAFLDESILNLRNPIFADWPRQPLQEELYGHHVAGEVFFQYLQQLLGRNDSQDLADLLEVYYLCLVLGFGGRYSAGGRGELRSVLEAAAEKIRRIRGGTLELSPSWKLPPEVVRAVRQDPWVRRLAISAIGSLVFAVILFVVFKVALGGGISALQSILTPGRAF
jgi:type VI secretion system protein ImpK